MFYEAGQHRFRQYGFRRQDDCDSKPESAPIKRIIQDAKERGTLIDATHGRRTRAVIITDSDHIILTYLQSETVANRMTEDENAVDDEEEEDE